MDALVSRGTWELISAPTDVVGCRWVYPLKFRPDRLVDRYKTRFVAKGYTQIYGIDYFGTFSPVTRMNSIRILFSAAVNLSCLFQLDVKNFFLYENLQEEIYLTQPPGYVAQGRIKYVISRRLFMASSRAQGRDLRSLVVVSLKSLFFIWHTKSGIVVLAVYVDDILLTDNDSAGLLETK